MTTHAEDTQHDWNDIPYQPVSPRAAMIEGMMWVYRALTTGDTVNAIRLAEWLRDSVRERLPASKAESNLVDVVNKILGERH